MNLKDTSSKIILHHIRAGYYLWAEMAEAEAELLSRLEQGQKALEILKEVQGEFRIETPQKIVDMVNEFLKEVAE